MRDAAEEEFDSVEVPRHPTRKDQGPVMSNSTQTVLQYDMPVRTTPTRGSS